MIMAQSSLGVDSKTEEILGKASFLSYYIATYHVVNSELGFKNQDVTVDEIFDFINDMRHEGELENIPRITKKDILLTFNLLLKNGVGKQAISDFAVMPN